MAAAASSDADGLVVLNCFDAALLSPAGAASAAAHLRTPEFASAPFLTRVGAARLERTAREAASSVAAAGTLDAELKRLYRGLEEHAAASRSRPPSTPLATDQLHLLGALFLSSVLLLRGALAYAPPVARARHAERALRSLAGLAAGARASAPLLELEEILLHALADARRLHVLGELISEAEADAWHSAPSAEATAEGAPALLLALRWFTRALHLRVGSQAHPAPDADDCVTEPLRSLLPHALASALRLTAPAEPAGALMLGALSSLRVEVPQQCDLAHDLITLAHERCAEMLATAAGAGEGPHAERAAARALGLCESVFALLPIVRDPLLPATQERAARVALAAPNPRLAAAACAALRGAVSVPCEPRRKRELVGWVFELRERAAAL